MKIIQIPFSGGGLGHGNGANKAPAIILEQFKNIFANEDGIQIENINVDESHIANSHEAIEKHIEKIKEPAILIGGDHSITYPTVKAFTKNNKDPWLVVFDAHPDLMDDFTPPTQEDYLRVLIEENIVNPKKIILIGVRNWDKIEVDYLKLKGIRYYTMKEIFNKGIKHIIKEITELIDSPLYLSIDIDAVDPVEAIGTGYTEHGGMSSRELIYAIQQLKDKVTMTDIVEVNPDKDVNNMTSILAAKLISELYCH